MSLSRRALFRGAAAVAAGYIVTPSVAKVVADCVEEVPTLLSEEELRQEAKKLVFGILYGQPIQKRRMVLSDKAIRLAFEDANRSFWLETNLQQIEQRALALMASVAHESRSYHSLSAYPTRPQHREKIEWPLVSIS